MTASSTLLAEIPNISRRTVGGPDLGISRTARILCFVTKSALDRTPATASPIPPVHMFVSLCVNVCVYVFKGCLTGVNLF